MNTHKSSFTFVVDRHVWGANTFGVIMNLGVDGPMKFPTISEDFELWMSKL